MPLRNIIKICKIVGLEALVRALNLTKICIHVFTFFQMSFPYKRSKICELNLGFFQIQSCRYKKKNNFIAPLKSTNASKSILKSKSKTIFFKKYLKKPSLLLPEYFKNSTLKHLKYSLQIYDYSSKNIV